MKKLLIILLLIVGCAPTKPVENIKPIEYTFKMNEDEFKTKNNELKIYEQNRDGIVYIAETAVERAEFSQTFNQLVSAGNVDKVWIKGDSLATWGAGVDVMATIASSGVSFSVVAEQRPNN